MAMLLLLTPATRRYASAGLGIALTWLAAARANPASLSFETGLVGSDEAREPTISYAPNGTIWYSGMAINPADSDGNLWYASSDTSAFVQHESPPTTGGADAVVHHDAAGRLFWGELKAPEFGGTAPALQVTVRANGAWAPVIEFPGSDRPWFRTNQTGVTFLSVTNFTDHRVEVWKNQTGSGGWAVFTSNVSGPAALADFVNHIDGRLYLLMRDEADNGALKVAHRGPLDDQWTMTSSIQRAVENSFGLPRIAVDLGENIFVVYGEKRDSDYSIWLRHYKSATNTWGDPWQIGSGGYTSARASVVAGSSGKLGIAWYETIGNFYPKDAPLTAEWRVKYRLISGATGTPSEVDSAIVHSNVHQGSLVGVSGLGDFSYIVRREGDADGKVFIGFICDLDDPILGCVSALLPDSKPFYARQTSGSGVLG